jgi:Cdc6-like AAA superfamily ATPase
MAPELQPLSIQTGVVFTPGAPISERELFIGRTEQVEKVTDAVYQRGYHAIVYGERGVGKTSLANVICTFLANRQAFVISRTNCDISDTYSSLWAKAFKDIEVAKRPPNIGFGTFGIPQTAPPLDYAANAYTPDSVRRTLEDMSRSGPLVIIFDEFDRIVGSDTMTAMADTIKTLSDHAVNVPVLIIGVADSVDELIREHQSIERALIQVLVPSMSESDIRSIVLGGFRRLTMGIDSTACEDLVRFSQGAAYITHLLCFYTARAALATGRKTVYPAHVEQGMNRALDQWQQSIKSLYERSAKSAQPSIYRQVLLACALAEVDERRYFTASSVKEPLRLIKNKTYEPVNYARHLKELSEPARGRVLHRAGDKYWLRYRICNPIMRPYIIMRGVREELITKDAIPVSWSKSNA